MSISLLVLQTIKKHNMIEEGDKILAAVSGGADSICMLHVLNSLKSILGFSLGCVHVNHGLRGNDADMDELFVKDFCKKFDIPFFSKKFDVELISNEKKLSLEEAGRYVRYSFFEEVKAKNKFTKIATAHNKDDNAETVLMRILRGTGLDGLSGIPYVRSDGVIRPILDIKREEVEEYLNEQRLDFRTDSTNFENEYTRNKVRNQLIPYIEKEFNLKFKDSLIRLSENAQQDGRFLNEYAERVYKRLGSPLPASTPNALHIESLKMLSEGIAKRVIRFAANKSVNGVSLEKKHMEDIFGLLSKQTGASLNLPNGLTLEINYGWLTFKGPLDAKVVTENDGFFTEISLGESVFLDSINKSISIRLEDPKTYKCKINEIWADFDKIGSEPLFLRSRRDGDKMVYFADGRSKKIKSIFIDQKIPKSDREKIPLLATGSEIIAIVGSRTSEKYKVTKETERALVIEYGTFN